MNLIREMLSYPFLVRALAGGMMVSLCASLLGVSLVLRRYSMIGDGLSHVSFGALSIALAMGWSVKQDPFLQVKYFICLLHRVSQVMGHHKDGHLILPVQPPDHGVKLLNSRGI